MGLVFAWARITTQSAGGRILKIANLYTGNFAIFEMILKPLKNKVQTTTKFKDCKDCNIYVEFCTLQNRHFQQGD